MTSNQNFEPCYCAKCNGKLPAPCRYYIEPEQRPSKELVHFYAGFPGKALCLNTDTPIGTNSNIHWENVTCPRCWIDFLIGDGKRDNIIVPMSIARDVQAALRVGAPEPPLAVREMNADDAPVQYILSEAEAWAAGYNAAIDAQSIDKSHE